MPLLGEEHLSKSAVSRVASRLKELFRHWSERDVSQERYAILFLDGFHLKFGWRGGSCRCRCSWCWE